MLTKRAFCLKKHEKSALFNSCFLFCIPEEPQRGGIADLFLSLNSLARGPRYLGTNFQSAVLIGGGEGLHLHIDIFHYS